MGTPVGRSGDLFVYTDSNGKRVVKPVVGNLSEPLSNGSPIIPAFQPLRTNGGTVVLRGDLSSGYKVNGNPVKDLHSNQGSIVGDFGNNHRIIR